MTNASKECKNKEESVQKKAGQREKQHRRRQKQTGFWAVDCGHQHTDGPTDTTQPTDRPTNRPTNQHQSVFKCGTRKVFSSGNKGFSSRVPAASFPCHKQKRSGKTKRVDAGAVEVHGCRSEPGGHLSRRSREARGMMAAAACSAGCEREGRCSEHGWLGGVPAPEGCEVGVTGRDKASSWCRPCLLRFGRATVRRRKVSSWPR